MKMSDASQAVGWKFNHAPGIRFMENATAVKNCGAQDIAIPVAGFFMVWPERLGPAPKAEDLASYVEEWKAATQPRT